MSKGRENPILRDLMRSSGEPSQRSQQQQRDATYGAESMFDEPTTAELESGNAGAAAAAYRRRALTPNPAEDRAHGVTFSDDAYTSPPNAAESVKLLEPQSLQPRQGRTLINAAEAAEFSDSQPRRVRQGDAYAYRTPPQPQQNLTLTAAKSVVDVVEPRVSSKESQKSQRPMQKSTLQFNSSAKQQQQQQQSEEQQQQSSTSTAAKGREDVG